MIVLRLLADMCIVLISNPSYVKNFEAFFSPHFSNVLINFSFDIGGFFNDAN